MRIVSVLAVAAAASLGLAACEPATTGEAPAADAAATDAAASQDVDMSDDGPEAFVQNVYSAMATDAPTMDPSLWSDAAWAEIEAYRALDAGGINVDPLCNCQDPAGISIRDLDVSMTGPESADAAVTTLQGEAQVSQVLNLVRENGVWKIDNITREGDPAFRDELAQWTAEASAAG